MYSELIVDEGYAGLNPCQFGYEACEAGHAFGPAVRSHWLIHYVVRGSGVFQAQGRTYSLYPGEMFVIAPGEVTFYQADGRNPWSYIWIGFSCAALPMALEKRIRCPEAQAVFESMKKCAAFENGRSAYLAARLWDLFGILLERKPERPDPADRAVSCMRAEYMNGLTVSEVAERLQMERTAFSVYFKRRVGMTPQRYLMNLRMEKAAELMTQYGETVTTAARSVGYGDLFNFSKMFKRHFSMSPRAYVQAFRRSEKTDKNANADENLPFTPGDGCDIIKKQIQEKG